jgi:hypothetical protein
MPLAINHEIHEPQGKSEATHENGLSGLFEIEFGGLIG